MNDTKMKKSLIFLSLFTTFLLTASVIQAQNSPLSFQGKVIDTTGGARWVALVIEANGEKYIVPLGYSLKEFNPKTIGDIDASPKYIGAQVKVTFKKFVHQDNGDIWVDAIQVIRLPATLVVVKKEPLNNQSFTKDFGSNTTAKFDSKGNLIGLYNSINCTYDSCTKKTVEIGTITQVSVSSGEIYDFKIKYVNGKIKEWEAPGNDFPGLWEPRYYDLPAFLIHISSKVKITSCGCGSHAVPALDSIVLDSTPQTFDVTGYIDVIENNISGCRIRIISGEKVYSGLVTFVHLSELVKQKIANYEDAVRILSGRQIRISLPNIESYNTNYPTVDFTTINKVLLLPNKAQYQANQNLKQRQTEQEIIVDISTDILFDFNESTIKPEAVPSLIKLAGLIRRVGNNTVQLNGFTDSIGADDYNNDLSKRRAESVKQWLVNRGDVAANILQTKGYGENQPIAPNTNPNGSDNPVGRQKNRRVEIIIPRKGRF